MRIDKAIIMLVLLAAMAMNASANSMRLVGFDDSVELEIRNSLDWFLPNAPRENTFFKILRYEMERSSKISMENIPLFIKMHFPLIVSDDQGIRLCQKPASQCEPSNFPNWKEAGKPKQILVQDLFKLYTPYLEKSDETSIIGFSERRLLSVQKRNQTIAIINPEFISQEDEESASDYKKWVMMSQWMALARLHQIFVSDGLPLVECKTNNGTIYLCDPYTNGSMYMASLLLLTASEECFNCSENEVIMLKLLAFDHALRTGKSRATEKVVGYIKKELGPLLEGSNDKIEFMMDIYRTRSESRKRGIDL